MQDSTNFTNANKETYAPVTNISQDTNTAQPSTGKHIKRTSQPITIFIMVGIFVLICGVAVLYLFKNELGISSKPADQNPITTITVSATPSSAPINTEAAFKSFHGYSIIVPSDFEVTTNAMQQNPDLKPQDQLVLILTEYKENIDTFIPYIRAEYYENALTGNISVKDWIQKNKLKNWDAAETGIGYHFNPDKTYNSVIVTSVNIQAQSDRTILDVMIDPKNPKSLYVVDRLSTAQSSDASDTQASLTSEYLLSVFTIGVKQGTPTPAPTTSVNTEFENFHGINYKVPAGYMRSSNAMQQNSSVLPADQIVIIDKQFNSNQNSAIPYIRIEYYKSALKNNLNLKDWISKTQFTGFNAWMQDGDLGYRFNDPTIYGEFEVLSADIITQSGKIALHVTLDPKDSTSVIVINNISTGQSTFETEKKDNDVVWYLLNVIGGVIKP